MDSRDLSMEAVEQGPEKVEDGTGVASGQDTQPIEEQAPSDESGNAAVSQEPDSGNAVEEVPQPPIPAEENAPQQPQVRTSNVVVSVSFGCPLDLVIIFSELGVDKCKYQPSKFHGLIYKTSECSFTLYSNGSVLCTGSKNVRTSRKCINLLASVIRNIGFNVVQPLRVKVGNRVGSFVLSCKDIECLKEIYTKPEHFRRFSKNNVVIYAPERFCGMTWYDKKGVAIVAFRTGRCIITGCASRRGRRLTVGKFLGEQSIPTILHITVVHMCCLLCNFFRCTSRKC